MSDLKYMNGPPSNEFQSEALPDSLPKNQNTPQRCPYGLIAEQLSGTSFTTPRAGNRRSWLYRIAPTCRHPALKKIDRGLIRNTFDSEHSVNPNQLRWDPLPLPEKDADFVEGIISYCGAGEPSTKGGLAIHMYSCNKSMGNRCFTNCDGDFLIVPQEGNLHIRTEFGELYVAPGEIAVVQRAMKFTVNVEGPSRGYIAEVYGAHLVIPDLGPIGSNGLANPRDFEVPVAKYEDKECTYRYTVKFVGELHECEIDHSPYDVVAWHGNYVPYKYNLAHFNTINSVSFDHLDPSTFTVLTSQTDTAGVAALDFAIFPPRFMVQKNTFRPPYYHRNVMSEFMGNIRGVYEVKLHGFLPGGASLHNTGLGHGPDGESMEKASVADLKPVESDPNSLAFMFESTYMFKLSEFAATNLIQKDYHEESWMPIKRHFDASNKDAW